MSTSNRRVKHCRSIMGTLVRVLTFAVVIGGIALVPARGQERERHQGQEEHDRRERERHDEHDRRERERHDERGRHERERHDERDRRAYSSYGYYAPPPVVYPPAPSPGINLFFHIP
jgi:hypothetical protein